MRVDSGIFSQYYRIQSNPKRFSNHQNALENLRILSIKKGYVCARSWKQSGIHFREVGSGAELWRAMLAKAI
ncbi:MULTISPECIES: hypothetical protein [unclassified Helicobacter]|uniref:hypothetical protein n=1 Tax=unclassified Helicobacter TaxID=2593540 RepID=UPI0011C01B91|nr:MULTISPECIES: hypothetical protein [unclassified Helicobacter]